MVNTTDSPRRGSFPGDFQQDNPQSQQPPAMHDNVQLFNNDYTASGTLNRDAPPHLPADAHTTAHTTTLGEEEEEETGTILPELRSLGRSLTLFKGKADAAVKDPDGLKSTLRATHKYSRNKALNSRRKRALEIAAAFFKNPGLQELDTLDRSLAKRNFVFVNKLLDQLLGECLRIPLTASKARELKLEPGTGVLSVDPILVIRTSHQLEAMGKAALRSFKLAGQRLPEAPTWPQEAGSAGTEFLLPQDFEIMGIAYRAQVEHYITALCDLHNFATVIHTGGRLRLHDLSALILSAMGYSIDDRKR
ncbi:hypothetical protein PM082_011946 [Marasmius tenuissimus]|nr:hypothetical protein PM082_011946 [Marasmius tenuissimus]